MSLPDPLVALVNKDDPDALLAAISANENWRENAAIRQAALKKAAVNGKLKVCHI